jgi:hypothetical protein
MTAKAYAYLLTALVILWPLFLLLASVPLWKILFLIALSAGLWVLVMEHPLPVPLSTRRRPQPEAVSTFRRKGILHEVNVGERVWREGNVRGWIPACAGMTNPLLNRV